MTNPESVTFRVPDGRGRSIRIWASRAEIVAENAGSDVDEVYDELSKQLSRLAWQREARRPDQVPSNELDQALQQFHQKGVASQDTDAGFLVCQNHKGEGSGFDPRQVKALWPEVQWGVWARDEQGSWMRYDNAEEIELNKEVVDALVDPVATGVFMDPILTFLSSQEKQEVMRAHCNAGHCDNRTLVRLLRNAGARADVLKYVAQEFQCDGCAARQRPRSRMPSALPRCYDFNVVCGADLLEVAGAKEDPKDKITSLNVICWGTLFNVFFPTPQKSKSSSDVWKAMLLGWIRVFGPMQVLLVDGGQEFVGDGFASQAERAGILLEVANADAPWERGRTERAGGIFKEIYYKARELASPINREECEVLIHEAAWAKSSMSNRSGYSPMQRVFGRAPVINLETTGDGIQDSQLGVDYDDEDTAYDRSQSLRKAARLAFIEVDSQSRVRRAQRSRVRPEADYKVGDIVKVFRRGRVGKTPDRWVGPGVVVGARDHQFWVSMRGELWRCARCQLRHCTREEKKGYETVADAILKHRERMKNDPDRLGFVRVDDEMGDPDPDVDDHDASPGADEDDREPPGEPGAEGGQGPGDDPSASQAAEPSDQPEEGGSPPSPSGHRPRCVAEEVDDRDPGPEGGDGGVSEPLVEEETGGMDETEEVEPGTGDEDPGPGDDGLAVPGDPGERVHEADNHRGPADDNEGGDQRVLEDRAQAADNQEATPGLSREAPVPRELRDSHGVEGDRVLERMLRKRGYEAGEQARKCRARLQGTWTGGTIEKQKFPVMIVPGDQGHLELQRQEKSPVYTLYENEGSVFIAGRGGELSEKNFTAEQKAHFDVAKKSEIDGVIDFGAIRVCSPEEGARLHASGHRVLPSQFVLTEKRQEVGQSTKAKARWCVLGNKDQEAYHVARFSPTPATSTLMMVLVVLASKKWRLGLERGAACTPRCRREECRAIHLERSWSC